MLGLLLAICIGLFIIGIILMCVDCGDAGASLVIIGGLCFLIVGLITIPVGIAYVGSQTVDEKIAMYQEENKKIEEKIEVTVRQYMDFEKDTYKGVKVDSYINLVSLYPDLKSDKLIKEQIETYQENSETIINLKEKKINQKTLKWWLNFGR